jgi:hypothetical protein
MTGSQLCLASGDPVVVYTVEAVDCSSGGCQSPTGAPVAIHGWLNLLSGVFTLGAPPAGTKACGEATDVEIVNKLCVFDSAGLVVGSAYTEVNYDETGATAPTYTLVGIDNNGVMSRPLTLGVGQTLGTCDSSAHKFEQLVHYCEPVSGGSGVCVEALAHYTRSSSDVISLNKISLFDGTDVTSTATTYGISSGSCVGVTCQYVQQVRIYLQTNTDTLTVGDIITTTSAARLLSLTIKQVAGTGSVTGDSGSGVAMQTGETWSWSLVDGGPEATWDSLDASLLTMVAGSGGQQRITATYLGTTAPALPLVLAVGSQVLDSGGAPIWRIVDSGAAFRSLFNANGYAVINNVDGSFLSLLRDTPGTAQSISFTIPVYDYSATLLGYAPAP